MFFKVSARIKHVVRLFGIFDSWFRSVCCLIYICIFVSSRIHGSFDCPFYPSLGDLTYWFPGCSRTPWRWKVWKVRAASMTFGPFLGAKMTKSNSNILRWMVKSLGWHRANMGKDSGTWFRDRFWRAGLLVEVTSGPRPQPHPRMRLARKHDLLQATLAEVLEFARWQLWKASIRKMSVCWHSEMGTQSW